MDSLQGLSCFFGIAVLVRGSNVMVRRAASTYSSNVLPASSAGAEHVDLADVEYVSVDAVTHLGGQVERRRLRIPNVSSRSTAISVGSQSRNRLFHTLLSSRE